MRDAVAGLLILAIVALPIALVFFFFDGFNLPSKDAGFIGGSMWLSTYMIVQKLEQIRQDIRKP
jgi:hypothetical protein